MVPETCSASLNKDNFLLLNRRLLLPHPRISIYQKDSVNEEPNFRYHKNNNNNFVPHHYVMCGRVNCKNFLHY